MPIVNVLEIFTIRSYYVNQAELLSNILPFASKKPNKTKSFFTESPHPLLPEYTINNCCS